MSPIARRSLFVAGAAALSLSLTACGGTSSTDQSTDSADQSTGGSVEISDITVGVFPSFNGLPAQVAHDSGAFETHNLSATLSTFATPAEATPQLLGGNIQFALMDMTVPILGKSKGVPLVMVAPAASGQIPDHSGDVGFVNIWVQADSEFTSLEELENATIAVPQINSQIWLDVREAIDTAGGDSSKTQFMEAPNTIAALKGGQADATTTAEPGGTGTLTDSTIKPLAAIEVGGGATAFAFVTTEEFAANNPNTVKAFSDAILEANKLINSDKAVAVESAGSLLDAPPELLEAAIYPRYVEEPITSEDIDTAIARMEKYNLFEAPAPAAEDLLVQ